MPDAAFFMEQNMKRLTIILAASLLLIACGKPRHLTFEEQQAYMAKEQCMQEATNMNPEWPNANNPAWYSYFVMCMNNFGISDKAINRMWY